MKIVTAPQPAPSVQPESVHGFPLVSVAATAAHVAIIAMPSAAAAAIVVVHTAISAELQDPFLYSEVSAAHTLNHMKTWPAQDKCGFCQVLPSQA